MRTRRDHSRDRAEGSALIHSCTIDRGAGGGGGKMCSKKWEHDKEHGDKAYGVFMKPRGVSEGERFPPLPPIQDFLRNAKEEDV